MRMEKRISKEYSALSMRFEEKISRKSHRPGESYYKLLEEVGYGVSGTVYRAIYLPANEVVAVKCLDLDRCNGTLENICQDAQTMSLIDHPAVIKAHCSFVVDHYLWVVMPFMAGGSCLHIMKSAYPNGFEESVIAKILKETLKALDYLHCQGHIHLDVKAGSILIDTTGVVKLGNFRVAAWMVESGDREWSRNSFLGTQCWMAPEVLQPDNGYDFKADIWSLGITALELAHGHAPFLKYPPMKALMTIQNALPRLDYLKDKTFSKPFKEMLTMCLVKEPTRRPTAKKLLKHSFFKQTKSPQYIAYNLFHGLPPLWERVKALQLKDVAQRDLKKMPSAEEELRSQNEYEQGVSAWNFDIDDLKAEATLIQDDNMPSDRKKEDAPLRESMKDNNNHHHSFCSQISIGGDSEVVQCFGMAGPTTEDSSEVEVDNNARNVCNAQSELKPALEKSATDLCKVSDLNFNSGNTGLEQMTKKSRQPVWEERFRNHSCKENAFSGPLLLPRRASANSLSAPPRSSGGFRDYQEDRTNLSVIQKKGRFSVTSTDIDFVELILSRDDSTVFLQSPPSRKSTNGDNWVSDKKQIVIAELPNDTMNTGSIPIDVLVPHLQTLLQQTVSQQENIVTLLSSLHCKEVSITTHENGKWSSQFLNEDKDFIVEMSTMREHMLRNKIVELQTTILSLTTELCRIETRNVQLQQLIATYSQQEEEKIQKEGREKDS